MKSGVDRVEAPVYSHLTYDRTDEVVTVDSADIVIVEGLNVLAPAKQRGDGSPGMSVSDYFDFSIYVDASSRDIRSWYIERFLKLRQTAFADPASYFHRYSALTDDEAAAKAARALGHHQLAEPAREHPDHPWPGDPRAAQGRRPLGQVGPLPQALTVSRTS